MWKLQQHIIINIGWDRLCPLKTTQSNRKIIKNTAITKFMAGYPLIQDQRSKMNTRFSTKGGSQTLMPKILKLPPNFCPLLPPTKILRPHFIHAPPPCSSTNDRQHAGKIQGLEKKPRNILAFWKQLDDAKWFLFQKCIIKTNLYFYYNCL